MGYATGARVALSSATKAIKLESLQAVDETLRRAALGRSAFVSGLRCADALKALAEGRFTGDDFEGTEPLATRLQGTWNVVMESKEYTKKYSPPSLTVRRPGHCGEDPDVSAGGHGDLDRRPG